MLFNKKSESSLRPLATSLCASVSMSMHCAACRYLDLRVEVQWQKEAMDSGKLVAKCPGCSFLVLCNELEARGIHRVLVALLVQSYTLRHSFTFWAYAGDALHQVLAERSPQNVCMPLDIELTQVSS